ncbi:hypothetical protein [Sandaracinus amylolyticus]|uniref:Tryptophan synthase alpha chain n=1 Tax=Sandaracinus amylolyticus TaxID=927083 RepID=A0A0F6VZ59_9BACT|nr:hypothetical protein [Sandaracinus amylolyticus]AKF03342.1 Tryptophan synthase alpha chain [Sandaracinus amylolyticus]
MRRFARVLALLLALGCDGSPPCVDEDLDGLGTHCEAGPDCDDGNAARGEDCDAVPAPDCTVDPTATGCPCLIGSVTDCFPGPSELAGVGECRTGRTRCVAQHWGLCDGSQGPSRERCDTLDQDCDGLADEGVRSPCGGCTASCTGELWGEPFDEAGGGLVVTGLGELTLAREERSSATVWAVNSAEATVSRIDAIEARETARYATGERDAVALEPSRVSVDWNGDAWVANRAFDGVPSVVRVAGDRARCVDRDASGTIETSASPEDVRAWGSDECVLASTIIGGAREVARAIAIDGDRGLDGVSGGDAWIGLHDGQAFVEVDGLRGDVIQRVETPGFSPYSAAFDPWGRLWAISRDGWLARIDPSADPPSLEIVEVPLACWLLYGMAIDGEGRIAMTGFSCDSVTIHDPRTSRWSTIRTEPSPRGAGFDGADLWVAHTGGRVSRLSLDPLRVVATRSLALDDVAPVDSIGIGADGLGHVWAISGAGGGAGLGVATRVDVEDAIAGAQVPVGASPHTQGDLAGLQLFGAPVPRASAQRVFDGCGADVTTSWVNVHVAGDPGTHGTIAIEVRHASDVASLASAPWISLGTIPDDAAPFPLALPEGGVIEVRVTLAVSASLGAPRLTRVGVEWTCPGPE